MNYQGDPEVQQLLVIKGDDGRHFFKTSYFRDWSFRLGIGCALLYIIYILQATDRHIDSVPKDNRELTVEMNQPDSCPDLVYPWFGEPVFPISSQYTSLMIHFHEANNTSKPNSIRVQQNSTTQEVVVTFAIKTGKEHQDRIYMMPEYVNTNTIALHLGATNLEYDDEHICLSIDIIVDVPVNTTLESFGYSGFGKPITSSLDFPAGLSLSEPLR
ncbi:hypothetical protein CLU79DRAFT_753990 [Phycomyces nitens]|nr:hypothetical protein CLU79DRAFT_753990 [Phycomyces nitens]